MADWNKSLIVVAVKELKTKPRFSSVWFPLADAHELRLVCRVCLFEYWQIYLVCPSIGHIHLSIGYMSIVYIYP